MEPAGEAVDRATSKLEEALALLSGEEDREQGEQQPKPDGSPPEEQPAAQLDPAEARRLMEEMDRKRREEEGKLFPGSGGPRVEKDW